MLFGVRVCLAIVRFCPLRLGAGPRVADSGWMLWFILMRCMGELVMSFCEGVFDEGFL